MKRISVLFGIFGVLLASAAGAQTYPSKPVRIVAPFPPGGVADVLARAIQPGLQEALGQQVIIDNKPGAGGNIGAEIVAKAEPDGHTLLLASAGILTINEFLYAKMPFDTDKAFAPITVVGDMPNIVVVHPKTGLNTLKELMDKAKAEPGKLNFSSVGKGSISQLSMELFNSVAGIKTVHIPYNGGAPAVTALIAGDVQILSLNPTALLPQVGAGKLKVLAQTSAKRSPLVSHIPTVAESGYPGFQADVWMAVMAPAKTPPEIIRRLNAELVKIIRSPEAKASLWDRQWIDPAGSPPGEVTALIGRESERWSATVRSAGIAIE
jgi:tripartite-type tricarboxylate transporter receptor subunit TctC